MCLRRSWLIVNFGLHAKLCISYHVVVRYGDNWGPTAHDEKKGKWGQFCPLKSTGTLLAFEAAFQGRTSFVEGLGSPCLFLLMLAQGGSVNELLAEKSLIPICM